MSIGIEFPFKSDDFKFNYLKMNETNMEEIKTNLRHLFITRKNTRFRNPDFGTNLYNFLFEQNDNITYESLLEEITTSVSRYIAGITINNIEFEQTSLNSVSCKCFFTVNNGLLTQEDSFEFTLNI